jgi:hypothetical protein
LEFSEFLHPNVAKHYTFFAILFMQLRGSSRYPSSPVMIIGVYA